MTERFPTTTTELPTTTVPPGGNTEMIASITGTDVPGDTIDWNETFGSPPMVEVTMGRGTALEPITPLGSSEIVGSDMSITESTEAIDSQERVVEPERVTKLGSFMLKVSTGLTKLKEWPVSHHATEAIPEVAAPEGKLTGTLLTKRSRLKGTLLTKQSGADQNNSGVELKAAFAAEESETTRISHAPVVEVATAPEQTLEVVEYSTDLDMATVVEMIGNGRVVKRAPTLMEIATDPDRENAITHLRSPENLTTHDDHEAMPTYEMAESEAVAGLMQFLAEVADQVPDRASRARDMLENITYIGEKERTEAMAGIAEYWKSWLAENPDRQICALASISRNSGTNKSDRYLLDGILSNFSDEELAQIGDRLVTGLSDLTGAPEDVKVVLLDDWTISGSQMETALGTVAHEAGQYVDSIELQLVTSTEERIRSGKTVSRQGRQHVIPIRSYFLSHRAAVETDYGYKGHTAYETGSHSSVDFDFQDMISAMKYGLDQKTGAVTIMPPTTNIRRIYKKAKLGNISRLQGRQRTTELAGVGV